MIHRIALCHILAFAWITAISCVSMPAIDGKGKVSPDETEYVAMWNADTHAEKMMQSKGWKKPTKSVTGAMWTYVAGSLFVLGVVCFAGGIVSHIHELNGAGMCLCGCAIGAAVIAEMSRYLWILGVFMCILIVLSIRLRGWTLFRKLPK